MASGHHGDGRGGAWCAAFGRKAESARAVRGCAVAPAAVEGSNTGFILGRGHTAGRDARAGPGRRRAGRRWSRGEAALWLRASVSVDAYFARWRIFLRFRFKRRIRFLAHLARICDGGASEPGRERVSEQRRCAGRSPGDGAGLGAAGLRPDEAHERRPSPAQGSSGSAHLCGGGKSAAELRKALSGRIVKCGK